jgi:hypothetical protein
MASAAAASISGQMVYGWWPAAVASLSAMRSVTPSV